MNGQTAAAAAARRGWAVFPCRPGDKRPAVDRWEDRACSDPELVARYFPPRCNVGIACGPSGLVVIDLDTAAHGRQLPPEWQGPGMTGGADVLTALLKRAGQPWPSTFTVRTPSGGTHLYFRELPGRCLRNTAGKLGPMIDTRAHGGYVVGAGSVVSGSPYEVILDVPPAPLPGWLADLADPPPSATAGEPVRITGTAAHVRLRGVIETVLSSEPGTRNGRLYWAACRAAEMVAAGLVDQAAAEQALVDAALTAGLRGGEREARRTVASGMRQGTA